MNEPDKKTPAEELVKSVEQTYSDLRQKNPDRDEHWLLANTCLERYGSGEEAREKGAQWTRFTAYKDTCEFAILEPPQSIRALALFLVFKELGDEPAKQYESEFFRLMEPVMKSKESRAFIDEYRQRNPLTWKEVEVADNSSYSLYWFLRGLELELEHDEEAEAEWGGDDIDFIDILMKQEEEESGED